MKTKKVQFKEELEAEDVVKMIEDKKIKILYVTCKGQFQYTYTVFYKTK